MASSELLALVFGDSPPSKKLFSVEASLADSVSKLKQLVYKQKRNRFKDIDADELILWKLNNPIPVPGVDAGVAALGQNLSTFATEMMPGNALAFYFDTVPERGHLHIIVQGPASRKRDRGDIDDDDDDDNDDNDDGRHFKKLRTEHSEAFKIAQNKPTPSFAATSVGLGQAQAKDPFLNGRPFEAVGPPITIYEPIFSTFLAMNEGTLPVDISPDDYESAVAFLVASAKIYPKEMERQVAITESLTRLLGMAFIQPTLNDKTSNDGAIQALYGEVASLLLVMEVKNNSGNGDPAAQADYSYSRWWADRLGLHLRQRTCCPSFLLSIAGPWICLQGGIVVGRTWVMQPLTECLWTGSTGMDMERRGRQIARLFCSLRVALNALNARFLAVKDIPRPSLPPIFPFNTSFTDRDTQMEVTLTYRKRLHFQEGRSGTAIFSATLNNGDSVLVKFAARYNALAHKILADEGLAPRLRYCSKLAPGETHFMVVMDRIVGHDMHGERFQEEDLARVRRAKELLHAKDYVFGDLRPNNVFKPTDGTGVILVDFDWCGQDGTDTYPLFINKHACEWHGDVKAGAVMRKNHDDHLFERL